MAEHVAHHDEAERERSAGQEQQSRVRVARQARHHEQRHCERTTDGADGGPAQRGEARGNAPERHRSRSDRMVGGDDDVEQADERDDGDDGGAVDAADTTGGQTAGHESDEQTGECNHGGVGLPASKDMGDGERTAEGERHTGTEQPVEPVERYCHGAPRRRE